MATTARPQLDRFAREAERRAVLVEIRVTRAHLKPPPKLTLSQWADRYRILSSETGARPGPFSTDEAPYQREPMDVIGNPHIPKVVLMLGSQCGKSEMLTNYIGYVIDQDPGPILAVQPTLEMAETYSKDRIAPMLRDTPKLRGKVADVRARDSGNTLLHKQFAGGQLAIAGANSPAGLAARPIRVLILDEVDRFPRTAGSEGRPSAIAESRTATFPNAKIVKSSSPTIEGQSEIHDDYERSDQREYFVPCPHCRHEQRLVFGGREIRHGLKWDVLPDGNIHAFYVCEACGALIEEYDKRWMLSHGRWIASRPEHTTPGFRLSALYSPFFSWYRLITRWLADKDDPLALQPFVNTILCELWREVAGEKIDPESLAARLEEFQPRVPGTLDADRSFVPEPVAVIVRTVDTQGDRLETAVFGFGEREEEWIIDFDLLPGDPSIPFGSPMSPWNALDEIIRLRPYRHASGAPMRCFPTFIDSGGHAAGEVYAFTKERNHLGVFAIKGTTEQSIGPILGKPTRNNRARAILYPVGSFTGKESMWKRLAKITVPGPGYVHLPDWLSGEQLSQLTNERLVGPKMVGGRPKYLWLQKGATEMFHLSVYALAALQLLPLGTRKNLGAMSKTLAEQGAALPVEGSASIPEEPETATTHLMPSPRFSRGGWVNRWRR